MLRKHGVVGSSPITSTKIAIDLNRLKLMIYLDLAQVRSSKTK